MAYLTLHDRLKGPIALALKKELGIKNTHALPRLEKVVVNVGINKSKMDSKEMQAYVQECLSLITGQKPVLTKSRMSISNFRIREGMVVGAKVVLRGRRMEEFVDRLVSYALPRIRDFQGLPKKLDGKGNYAIGIKDHSIFPEIPPADARQIFGLQIQFSMTTESDQEALALLKQIGVPFKPDTKQEKKKQEEAPAPKAEEKEEEKVEKKEEVAEEAPAEPEEKEAEQAPAEEAKEPEQAEEKKETPKSDTES